MDRGCDLPQLRGNALHTCPGPIQEPACLEPRERGRQSLRGFLGRSLYSGPYLADPAGSSMSIVSSEARSGSGHVMEQSSTAVGIQ